MKRLIRYLLGLFGLTLLVLMAGGAFLVSTQTGAEGLLALAKRVLPGEFTYGPVQGRLLGPLKLKDLRYTDGVGDYRLATAELHWQPSSLFTGKLQIVLLKASGIEAHLPASGPAEEPAHEPLVLRDIVLPLQVEIAGLMVNDVRIHPAGTEAPVVIDGIALKAHSQDRSIFLDALKITAPQADLKAEGRISPVGAYPLDLSLEWTFRHPGMESLSGQGRISGDLHDLSLAHTVSGPVSVELTGQARHVLQDPAWSAQLKWRVPDVAKLIPGQDIKEVTGQLKTEGSLRDFQASGELAAMLPEIGQARSRFKLSGSTAAVQIQELILTSADKPLALQAQGEFKPSDLSFSATAEWQELVWPLTGPAQVSIPRGSLKASGTAQRYSFNLDTQLLGPNIPKGEWKLSGQGSDQALSELDIAGKLLEGEIKGKLSARWQPEVAWQADLGGSGLNPGAHWPDIPGKLNFTAHNTGALTAGKLETALDLADLSGVLNGQEVQGKAQLSVRDQDLDIKAVQLRAGSARLDADGTLAERWDIRWKLDVPDLNRLLPAGKGRIAGAGNLSGPRDKPQAELKLNVQDLAYGDSEIRRLRADARVDLSGTNRSQINLGGDDLHLAGQVWQSLALEGSGTPIDHSASVKLIGEPGRFALSLNGSLKDETWRGRLTTLTAQQTAVGDWALEQPVALQAAANKASIETACLGSRPSRLCIEGQWDKTRGASGKLDLRQLNPDRFAALLPDNLRIDTRIDGEAAASLRPDGALLGQLNVTINPGKLRMDANGTPVEVALGSSYLRAEAKGKEALGKLRLDLGDAGRMEAELKVADLGGQSRLAGKLDAQMTKPSLVSAFAPQLQNVSGRLTADLAVSGTVSAPALRGELRLSDAAADVPEAGIRVQAIQVTVSGDGEKPLSFAGSARSGDGEIKLSGQFEPASQQLNLSIKGDKFQAVNTATMQAQISPDLTVAMAKQQVNVNGQVLIPKAFFSAEGIGGGGVNPSSDVVIVRKGQEGKPTPAGGLAIYASVRVILGDDVRVAAAEFKGQLKGNLLVEQTPQLAPRGSGNVEVVAGDYKVYGQDLKIERGRVLFSGGPIDNPGLDLRVSRTVDEVTAGAQIRGTLKSPQLTLFSEPSMPDSSILSYLVLGRSPSGSGQESSMLRNAAAALAMSGGNKFTKGLSNALGLDELQFASGATAEDSSLVIGKYLSPGLYVSYGIGLFEAVSTFKMRYRIKKGLQFEASATTTATGADLIYTTDY